MKREDEEKLRQILQHLPRRNDRSGLLKPIA